MRILLTGGSGLLGRMIGQISMGIEHLDLYMPTHKSMDITNYKSIKEYVGYHAHEINVIVHAAALTGLERCEKEKDNAYNTNVIGTIYMNRIAKEYHFPLIYISTDYIFDGQKGNYKEEDTPNPLSYYAITKSMGECVTLFNEQHIIRTSFCKEKWEYPKAFIDKFSSLDNVKVIADRILKCVRKCKEWKGILHVGTERKSFYEIAYRTNPKVLQCSYKDVSVDIPPDTSLNCDKMKRLLK